MGSGQCSIGAWTGTSSNASTTTGRSSRSMRASSSAGNAIRATCAPRSRGSSTSPTAPIRASGWTSFPRREAAARSSFIHGGYWRSLDKDLFSWIAAPFVAAGIGVVLPRYRFVPAASIEDAAEDAIDAVNWVFESGAAHGLCADRVVLSGWSAGAHLAASVFAAPGARLRFDPARIAGGIAVSGVYEFEPLRHFSFNAEFRLDPAAVARLDLAARRRSIEAPLVVAAGANESSEFRRQSRVIAEAWHPQSRPLMLLPGMHHFAIVDALAERGQPLHDAALAFF